MGQPAIDQHEPGDKWEFDEDVMIVFDDMLNRSIPQYRTMRKAVTDLAARHARIYTDVMDLGCSRGDAMAEMMKKLGPEGIRWIGCDASEPMVRHSRQRFRQEIEDGHVSIQHIDLKERFPIGKASVILSVLTLQFIPIEHRQKVVQEAFDHLLPGGAFIVVEKVLGANARFDAAMVAEYYDLKGENGYTQEQILRKRIALEGVLVPVTAKWNEDFLEQAGFKVDCFWRWMNFAGWLAIKH